jgi:hypothetical protein
MLLGFGGRLPSAALYRAGYTPWSIIACSNVGSYGEVFFVLLVLLLFPEIELRSLFWLSEVDLLMVRMVVGRSEYCM